MIWEVVGGRVCGDGSGGWRSCHPSASPGIPRSHRCARSRPLRFAKGADRSHGPLCPSDISPVNGGTPIVLQRSHQGGGFCSGLFQMGGLAATPGQIGSDREMSVAAVATSPNVRTPLDTPTAPRSTPDPQGTCGENCIPPENAQFNGSDARLEWRRQRAFQHVCRIADPFPLRRALGPLNYAIRLITVRRRHDICYSPSA